MTSKKNILNYPHLDKIIFALSIMVCAFWYAGQQFNVYQFTVVGAVFEFASLPMLGLLIGLPVIAILLLLRKKFSLNSLPFYSLLFLTATFLYLVLH